MIDLSPLAVGLIVAAFTALLAGLGWLISSQISTNKSLSKGITDVVREFQIAMALLEERSKTQKTLCQNYRSTINEKYKTLELNFQKVENKITNINH